MKSRKSKVAKGGRALPMKPEFQAGMQKPAMMKGKGKRKT